MQVTLENLTKKFPGRGKQNRKDVIAVNNFTFEIPDGKLVGLLGPSGCGKSTMLNLLSGLLKPTQGRIFFGDEDVTDLLASADLIKHQNKLVAIKGAKVVASKNAAGEEFAFPYNWDGSGQAGNDLYFNIEVEGKTYNMCVESYLTADGTAAYDAVEALAIGDTVDLQGFLYWYDGVNPHITGVTASK